MRFSLSYFWRVPKEKGFGTHQSRGRSSVVLLKEREIKALFLRVKVKGKEAPLRISSPLAQHAAFGQIIPTILYTYTSSFFGYIDVEGPLHKTQYPNYQCSQKRKQ
jgi:hypothetical protein